MERVEMLYIVSILYIIFQASAQYLFGVRFLPTQLSEYAADISLRVRTVIFSTFLWHAHGGRSCRCCS